MEYVKNMFGGSPQQLTYQQQVTQYVTSNPSLILKGIPVVVVGWYAIPIVISAWMWLPWIWVSYEIYNKTDLIGKGFNFAKNIKGVMGI